VTEDGQPIIRGLNESAARGECARAADWFTVPANERVMIPGAPPLDVVRDLLTLPDWPKEIPIIRAITENPVIRQDGSILDQQGYDGATQLYYSPAPSLDVPRIADHPTTEQVAADLELLLEVFCDFPFDSPASRANILAALLTPIVRPLVRGPTPLCIIDKPQLGSGASLIATIIAVTATGRPAAMMTAPRDPMNGVRPL